MKRFLSVFDEGVRSKLKEGSLGVPWWLRLCGSNAGNLGLIPG